MASFTDLAKPYVEKLINGAIAESSYICCFTCIAKDFEQERAILEVERTTVKQRVDVATRGGEDVQANALYWVEEADKLIREDTKTKQKCLFGFCPHIIWQYKRGKDLANKKEQIIRLIQTGKDLVIGLPARLPDVERYSSRDYISFESRKSKYKELFDALKDDNSYITGLQGMGGTGKTTMAKEVGKELKQSKQFAYVIDATVSSSPDIRKIQDDIAGPLGLKLDDCNESDRPKKLLSRLTNEGKIDQNEEKKILLILDDVWAVIEFDEIGIPHSDKNCRILVTTRNLDVCNRLKCNKTIQLKDLCDEEAWTMFQRHAGLKEMSPNSLKEKGRKIANECKGLPIAIAVIASSLYDIQNPKVWDGTLNSLQKTMHGDDEEVVKIYKCLQFSYDNMKNEKAKKLFLLCSVFREDETIPTERLTRLGIGGGLFGEDFDSYDDARNQVVNSTNKLLEFCLLLEADQDQSILRMHDLVRDAAQWIANKEIQTVKLYDKYQKVTNIKYLLCEGKPKDVFPFKLDGSKLEILIVAMHRDEDCHDVKIEVPDSFFENITGLRVFHVIYDRYPELALSLPHSIQSLKNIRSLLFTNVDLGDISILGNLQSLETLDLADCKIDELPNGITKLEKFRLLNLECCRIARKNPFEVIDGCSSLEELYFIRSFNEFCREITTFPELQRFYIEEDYGQGYELSSKCVSLVEVFLSEKTLKHCMKEAEVLRLRKIEGGWRNIIPDIVPMDHGMNDLVELSLRSISKLQCLIDTNHTESQVSKVFSKLVVLKLKIMDDLEELFNGPLSFDSLNSLEKLSIENCKHLQSLFKYDINLCNLKSLSLERCPKLISIFQLSTAVSLVLERLEISDCECLKYIKDERKGEETRSVIVDDDNDNTTQGPMFQKLKVLSIKKCPSIELIFPFHSTHDLPALESITIESCDKLKYIFGQDVKLGSLKQLELDDIPNLINIFPECNRTMSLSIKKPSFFSRDASEPQAKPDLVESTMFQKLEVLIIKKCPRIESIRPFHSAHDLPALESITIKDCDKWKYIFGQDVKLGSLKQLELDDIPNLINIFPKCNCTMSLSIKKPSLFSGDASKPQAQPDLVESTMFQKLEVLIIKKCPRVELILPFHSAHDLPALESIRIEDCDKLKYIFGQDVKLGSLKELELDRIPNFIDIFPECNRTMTSISEPKEQSEPIKCNIFSWTDIYCCGKKYGHKLWSNKSTEIPLVSEDQQQDNLMESNPYPLNIWERARCLSRQSHILCNIKEIELWNISRMRSVFILSIAPRTLESLKIGNCNELMHIIIDIDDHDNTGGNNLVNVFPKLKRFQVQSCKQLKYIFGSYTDDHVQNHMEIHLHLPSLEDLYLGGLPILVGMCPKQYRTTYPHLKDLHLRDCPQFIGDFITHHSVTRSVDGTIIKELSGNVEHFHTLESLKVGLDINEQQMNLGLERIDLYDMSMMTCLFVGPKNSISLQNLTDLTIMRCEKLKIVFSTSITRCLPHLLLLRIKECNELEHIIEVDLENKKSTNSMSTTKTCFPKLNTIFVVECNKLKYVFPISICKELPELQCLIITEADELEEIFVSEDDNQKVEIPNLIFLVFVNLPSLNYAQRIQFQDVKHRFIRHCQKLSLASASTAHLRYDLSTFDFRYDCELEHYLKDYLQQIKMKQTPETKHELVKNVPPLEIPSNSDELMNEQSMDQQRSLGETDTAVKLSQCLKETEDQSIQGGPTSELVSDLEGSQETTQTNDNQVSLNGDAVMKVRSNMEEQFPVDDDITISKAKLSPSIASPIASQFPSLPSKDFDLYLHMESVYRQFQAKSDGHETGNENPNAQTTKEFAAWVEAEAASRHALTSSKLEGSTSENTATAAFSTISGTKNEPPIQLDVAPKQKGMNISFEEGTTSTYEKTITSSTHSEVGDGKICKPSVSIVNRNPPSTKYVNIGDSSEIIAMEDINKLIEEDPLLAFEKLLTGGQSFPIRSLLQKLKTLMDSSSDLDHLVSNQESKLKFISLLRVLNHHQGLLPSNVKEFVEKVHNFFNDYIVKHATSQQILKKHNQLLDLKTNLMQKLWSAKSTQVHIDGESSTANAQIHELSLQMDNLEKQRDDLKSVVNKCDVQKEKLKVECTEWARESKELLSALVSTEVDVVKAELVGKLATEDFANFKSSFPTF